MHKTLCLDEELIFRMWGGDFRLRISSLFKKSVENLTYSGESRLPYLAHAFRVLRNLFERSPDLGLSLPVGGYTNHALLHSFIGPFSPLFIHMLYVTQSPTWGQMKERTGRRSIRGRKGSNYQLTLYSVHLDDYIFYLILCHF